MSTTDTSLEQRIAALEDRAAISELLARFCLYADQRRWEELVELYTEDGVFDVMGPVTGRAAILEAVSHLPELWGHWFHFVSNELIELDGERARAVSYFNAPYSAGGVSNNAFGRYDDELQKVDGEWRFAARVLSFAVNAPMSDGMSETLPDGMRRAD